MPISDLTGTTWRWDDEILPTSTDIWTTFSINFTSNSTSYSSLGISTEEESAICEIRYGNTAVYDYGRNPPKWTDQAYRTITFTGGTAATNATLIGFVEARATQASNNPQFTIDLTTLTNYSTIFPTEGNYTITVKAEANNYNDSVASNSETYTKAGSGYDLTLNFIARNYRGAGYNYLMFKINTAPSSDDDFDYELNTPYAGSTGNFEGETELVNLHYDTGGTYTIHNVTSVTMWIGYDDFDDSDYICINGSTDDDAAPAYPGTTMSLSANTTINIYYDYDV